MSHTNKIAIILFISATVVLSLVGARAWWKSIQLDNLAQDTCAELEGAIVMQAGPILHKSVSRAERLGYTGFDLGDKMKRHCPSIMNAISDRSRDAQRRQ